MKRQLSKLLSMMLAFVLVFSMFPMNVHAEEDGDYKFIVEVSSEDSAGKKNAVTATVYSDYRAEMVIDEGNVNTGNVTVALWMKNVASLGVQGERHYERKIQTGMDPRDVSLDTVVGLFAGLKNAEVIGKIDDKSVKYTVTNEGRVIKGIPDSYENASAVWHGIVNEENITAGTHAEDSYILIPEGSYVQVAGQILTVDQELKVDNLSDIAGAIKNIRDAVTMQAAEEAVDDIRIFLKPGAELAVGSSTAKLNEEREAFITIDIDGCDESVFVDNLNKLRDAGSVEEMIKAFFAAISAVTTEMNGRTTTVEFAFGHDWTEWEVVKEPTKTEPGLRQRKCRRCGETETEEIPVIETVAVTSVELDKTELALKVGESETLTATVLPENADDKSVTWSSSDPSVVTVDENGKVTAVADNGMEDPSTAVITVTTNDGGYTAECTVTSEDPINGFVRRLYSMCLGRKADEHGFKDWTGWLRSGKLTAAQTVQGFFNSPEMEDMELTDEEWVEKCYAVILDRESEAEGKAFWADLRGSGVSNNFILKGFVESREFAELCAKYGITPGKIELTEWRDRNPGVTKFVNRCYTKALGRKAEAGGLNSWCRRILSASNKKAEAIYTATTGFFHSPEFLNKKTTDEEYVTILYRTFLGREPEPEGFNDWVNRLKSGMSRDEVMMGFANSKEFDAIMKECGIE